ncbi:sensor histidine kinase [Paenibacillus medicaginis]|uniref:histidine kinase n=1 Tax=Paenibacillus medicaginis TaxID=1470560 RepID=A0ABV5C5V0_9BACL
MTIKKRLFYSNLLMVISPLIAMLIIGTVLFFIGEAFFSGTDEVDIMNDSLLEMQRIIDSTDIDLLSIDKTTQNNLMNQLSDKGFQISGVQAGEILFTNMNLEEQALLPKYLEKEKLYTANQTLWIRDEDYFLLWRHLETDTQPLTLIVLGFNEVDRIHGAKDTAALISLVLLILISIVFIVILFSLYFANKMIRNIMIPINHLYEGAQRIREGNLDQDIFCHGAEELEDVCETFNEMQHQLKERARKNEIYERDRNEMLAGISHDLRTPLTSIKSYVRGLQDDIAKTPDKQKEYLEVVYLKACQIEKLINSLFLFSKLETGKFPFDFKSVSIQNFIVTLLDSVEYDLNKNNAVLTLNSTCTDQKVYIDGAQMSRVITNILDNSLNYNPNRQIHITVTLSEVDGIIVIRIQDDGVGVSDKQLLRLFDSFYRGDESRNNAAEGSGLGLAIARNIVNANNGKIYAKNDNGLAVIIELPVEKEGNQ